MKSSENPLTLQCDSHYKGYGPHDVVFQKLGFYLPDISNTAALRHINILNMTTLSC